jgi:hypothetical protein
LIGAALLAAGCGRSGSGASIDTASITSLPGSDHTAPPADLPRKASATSSIKAPEKPADKKVASPPAAEKTAAVPVPPAPAKIAKPAESNSPSKPLPSDEEIRKQMVGKWRQDHTEKRTISVKADGTAIIVAELSDYRQYIVGKSLRFDLQWTLKDSTLTFITLGGDPPESIKYINAIYGKTRAYRVREFSRDRMLPQKADTGEIEPEWTRISEEAASK